MTSPVVKSSHRPSNSTLNGKMRTLNENDDDDDDDDELSLVFNFSIVFLKKESESTIFYDLK
ncbi:hypothetical protein E2C01_073782 [Portunus trituberculatus]|uniref:Uncharacterized protein n=1 Tax=Portunus trituberculatus TaxID=210409 RepID=A0A5B7IAL9_PORTR|nr:hypothetical protein [Portunus trituberculatus]